MVVLGRELLERPRIVQRDLCMTLYFIGKTVSPRRKLRIDIKHHPLGGGVCVYQ